jgi:glycosyltransferase involved in cell wall biosynthesis
MPQIVAVPRRLNVVVCACTYRRPAGLARLLAGLAAQTFAQLQRPNLRIIIADNEGSDPARDLCDRFRGCGAFALTYLHEPQRGVSHARNACLDRLPEDVDLVAFIDDDEVPHPDWIEQLLLAQQRSGADAVQGQVLPELPDGTPDWIVRAHLSLARPPRPPAGLGDQQAEFPELDRASTNNALVRWAVVRELGLRFDPRLALTGGEDIVFFRALKAAGHRIVYAPRAHVGDIIPPARARLGYLGRRWFRSGCNEAVKAPRRGKPSSSLKRIVIRRWRASGCPKLAAGIVAVLGNLLMGRTGMDHLAHGLRLIAHGLGQAVSLLGFRYEHYR